jgi:hypothetical protein
MLAEDRFALKLPGGSRTNKPNSSDAKPIFLSLVPGRSLTVFREEVDLWSQFGVAVPICGRIRQLHGLFSNA